MDVVTAAARERLQSGEEQDALASGDVVDGAARVDEVERPGGKVVGRVALHPVDLDAVGAREALRLVEPGRRDVHARDVAPAGREVHAVASLAAAELQDACPGWEERAHRAGEVRGRQAPDVFVRGPRVLAGPRAPGHRVSQPT